MLSIISLIPEVISLVRELFSLARELKLANDKRKVIDFVRDTNSVIQEIKKAQTPEEKQKLAQKMSDLVRGL